MRRIYFILFFVISFISLKAQVVISEIMYNDPSAADTLEYIELTNTGITTINLQNYYFGLGVSYTFPSMTIAPGAFLIIAKDSVAINKYFNKPARQWKSGALNNNGEAITLRNNSNQLVDSVMYQNASPWYHEANGGGFSLNLCNLTSDNSLASNWGLSLNNTGAVVNGLSIYASPGSASNCADEPLVKFLESNVIKGEGDAGIIVKLVKQGLGTGTQKVNVVIAGGTNATNNQDYILNTPYEVTFNASAQNDTQTFVVPLIDDTDIEGQELLIFTLANPQNLDILPNFNQFEITIIDNDVLSSEALILTGIFDAQPGGIAGAKGIEIYVLKDVADLSKYGIGSANNGGGSDGVEFVFPAVAVTKGTYIHIASDSADFHNYFGFEADYISGAVNINGDDAMELFESGGVIDIFGLIDVDGTGQPWEYLDGWAYRKDGTGPDGSTFVISNWIFSGVGVLDGPQTNAETTNPFPINTYDNTQDTITKAIDDFVSTDINSSVIIDVLQNDNLPNGVKTLTANDPVHGTTQVSGNVIIYTPDNGYCGPDIFTYIITDNKNESSFANVIITVTCASNYPVYTIATVTTNNALGVADSLDVYAQLQGVVYGNDFMGNNNIQFYMIDATGGISVFGNSNFGYTVKEGDEVIVRGKIDQFAGLTQITPDTLWLVNTNNPLKTPTIVSILSEATESEFVKILKLHFKDKSQWLTGMGTGFNVELEDDFGNDVSMRIDNDVDLFNMPAPISNYINVTGIGSQFDNTQPFNEGYQIFPRYQSDIEEIVATYDPTLQESIKLTPNLFREHLIVSTTNIEAQISIYDIFGKVIISLSNPENGHSLDMSSFPAGVYFAKIQSNDRFWTQKLIKQ